MNSEWINFPNFFQICSAASAEKITKPLGTTSKELLRELEFYVVKPFLAGVDSKKNQKEGLCILKKTSNAELLGSLRERIVLSIHRMGGTTYFVLRHPCLENPQIEPANPPRHLQDSREPNKGIVAPLGSGSAHVAKTSKVIESPTCKSSSANIWVHEESKVRVSPDVQPSYR